MPEDEGRAQRELAQLHAIVDKLPAMLAYWDADLRCRFANRAYELWFGVKPEALLGKHIETLLGPLYPLNRPHIEAALRGEDQLFERVIPDPAGGPPRHAQAHYISDVVDGTVRGFTVLVVDITARKHAEEAVQRMERKLRATERLTAMATLAGGIAHEINNPLASIVASLDFGLERLDAGPSSDVRAALTEARESALRASAIVQSMKLLARGDPGKRELVDVDATLEESVAMASNVIRYRARVTRELGGVGAVLGNPSQLAQVFVNLLLNAAHALPEERAEQNEIRVTTRRDGDRITIAIADNGAGIPEELQTRIFEPFFTTKDVGGGLGLGLSISAGLVEAMGGEISVRSRVAEGSVFEIVLPAAGAQAPRPPTVRPEPAATPAREPLARPRVLIVDDEPALGRSLARVLSPDYEVTVLTSGRAAIEALVDRRLAVDVILCDLMMPAITGADVHAAVLAQRPELEGRFIFMTGGAFTPRGREFLETVRAPVLDKPFESANVRALVGALTK